MGASTNGGYHGVSQQWLLHKGKSNENEMMKMGTPISGNPHSANVGECVSSDPCRINLVICSDVVAKSKAKCPLGHNSTPVFQLGS